MLNVWYLVVLAVGFCGGSVFSFVASFVYNALTDRSIWLKVDYLERKLKSINTTGAATMATSAREEADAQFQMAMAELKVIAESNLSMSDKKSKGAAVIFKYPRVAKRLMNEIKKLWDSGALEGIVN